MSESSTATHARKHDAAAPTVISRQARGFVSLLILVHVFCLVTVLLGNHYASQLQIRLIRTLGPYTRLLYLDPQVILGFHLTQAMPFEDDHFLEVELDGKAGTLRYPEPDSARTGWRGGLRHHRWKMLIRRLAMNVDSENDRYLAQVCQAIGRNLLGDGQERMVIRIVRRMPLELAGPTAADEGGPDAYVTVYAADIRLDDDGQVVVIKRVDVGEAAPVDAGS